MLVYSHGHSSVFVKKPFCRGNVIYVVRRIPVTSLRTPFIIPLSLHPKVCTLRIIFPWRWRHQILSKPPTMITNTVTSQCASKRPSCSLTTSSEYVRTAATWNRYVTFRRCYCLYN
jgi:hypothetical protein